MTPDSPTSYEALFGGLPTTVRVADHAARTITIQDVFVRVLPVGEYPRAYAAYADEFALADLYCGQPAGWSRNLAPEDFSVICREGERLNADFFAWCERKLAREMAVARQVAPEMLDRALAKAAASGSSLSATTSRTSPPPRG